jgi:RNA polymerase sigma-B factor
LVSFATLTILGELRRYFRDRAWSMRVPRRLQETYLEAKAIIDSLTQEIGHSPTYQEIAARLEITNEELLEALEAGRNFYPLSFDGPSTEDSSAIVRAPAFDDPGLLSTEDRRFLSRLAEGLPAETRRAVELRFNQDLTQAEIARELGVSQMQVSRTLAKALRHMREQAQT